MKEFWTALFALATQTADAQPVLTVNGVSTNYTTTHLFIGEVSDVIFTTLTCVLAPNEANVEPADIFSNLNNRDRAAHPTAKLQMLFAQEAHEVIWPARIGSITSSNGTNQLTAVNLAIERNGGVQASTSLTTWTNAQAFPSTNTTQVIPVPASGPPAVLPPAIPLQLGLALV